ncbi:MAG: ATP-dependent helicase, partial [Desulfurivibrionaceae bacterium]
LSPALLDSGASGGVADIGRNRVSPAGRQGGGQGGERRPDINLLVEGIAVRHPFFGEGKVEKKSGKRSVEVFFSRHGRKILHLDYAKLEIIG